MSEAVDWQDIQLPEGVDVDQLYEQVIQDPQALDRLVNNYFETDPKWTDSEKKLKQLKTKEETVRTLIKDIKHNNKLFDDMMEEYAKIVRNRRTTTITETVYFDREYTYYSEPIQTVIETDQLRQRMATCVALPSTSRDVKTEPKANGNSEATQTQEQDDDVVEVSVIYVNPTAGPKKSIQCFIREVLKTGDKVFAAKNAKLNYPWKPATVTKINAHNFVSVSFDDRTILGGNMLSTQAVAYNRKTVSPMTIGERVIAYLGDTPQSQELYSGTVAEPARRTNDFRYLVFFDKHAYGYVKREEMFYICQKVAVDKIMATIMADIANDGELREYVEFLKNYIKKYPDRPMLRLKVGDDRIKVRHRNRWENAKVLEVDASLAKVLIEKEGEKPHIEWIYRGSRRLYDIHKECPFTKSNVKQKAGKSTTRVSRRHESRAFVEWNTEDDDKENEVSNKQIKDEQSEEDILEIPAEVANRKRKLKQTARKSTAKPSQASASLEVHNMISSLLGDTIEVAVEQNLDLSMATYRPFIEHQCNPECLNRDAEEHNRFYDRNPFYIPIEVGYRRECITTNDDKKRVVYRAPCGRRLRDIFEVFKYLDITRSELDIDVFTFRHNIQLFRKSEPLKAYVHVPDLTNGLERQPISCVNTLDNENLGNVLYRADRFSHKSVHIDQVFDRGFLACCDCTDNCYSDECQCKRLTYEASETIKYNKFQTYGYEYKRLNDFVLTAVYECNSQCRCNEKCGNRVVQNGLKCRLQLFKTLKKGWGVRVLHDVPKGAFLCTYAAQILNEEAADTEGKTFGDEYLADLDYIDICEGQKEGYESDVELSDEDYNDSDENHRDEDEDDDEDYKCNYYSKKKGRSTTGLYYDKEVDNKNIVSGGRKRADDYKRKKFSIREDFYKEDFCYSLDAKQQGNIGRYLNHSCEPNCFVQNVFIDTHDLRFPWVAFFAKKDILAYEELTWDYNYEIGSIEGRKLYCYCGAHRCKKRLL